MYRGLILLLLIALSSTAIAGDPTRPAWGVQSNSNPKSEMTDGTATLKLQQIVRRDGGVSVVINNRLYRVGDAIAGFRLIRVRNNQVFIQDGQGNISTLSLANHVSAMVAKETE